MMSQISERSFDDRWNDINELLVKYRDGEKLSRTDIHKVQTLLYNLYNDYPDAVFEKTSPFVRDFAETLEKRLKSTPKENFATKYVELWNSLNKTGNNLQTVLNYIENNYITRISRPYNVVLVPIAGPLDFDKPLAAKDNTLKSWNETLLESLNDLVDTVFNHLKMERKDEGEQTRGTVKTIIESFNQVEEYKEKKGNVVSIRELYKTALEEPIKKQIEEYYKAESNEYLKSMNPDDYIKQCTKVLRKEEEICQAILPLSKELMVMATWKCLASDHMDVIVERFHYYFKNQDFESLSLVYHLMKLSEDAMKIVKQEIQAYEEKVFTEVGNSTEEANYCDKFLEVYKRERNIIENVFHSHKECVEALDRAICSSWNNFSDNSDSKSKTNISKISDILVKYCNQFLTKGTKGMEESVLDMKLDDVIIIFKFIEDKDVFLKLYTRSLARRSINSLSQSKEAEDLMVNKLRNVCGLEYVRRLDKILQDVVLSKDHTQKFQEEATLPYSLDLLVTQTGSWPIQLSKSSLLVPQELATGIQLINEFYTNNHKGRRLHFHHGYSTCEVKFNYLKKKYTVHTSISLMSVLFAFNNSQSVKFSDIKTATGIEDAELNKYVQYLRSQDILLVKDADNMTDDSELNLNLEYDNKRLKFKLMPVMKDPAQETEQDVKVVIEDRKMFLQALIVRIMKGKKTMNHKDLANEIVQQSVQIFVPSQTLIKSVIKYLIEKEYLEMAENSEDTYNYLA